MKLNFEKLLEKLTKKLLNEEIPKPRIGATIKVKRKSLEKTLEEVSSRSGVSLSYMSKLENNQLQPNFQKIRKILTELNLNEAIFDYSTDMTSWYNELLDLMLGLKDDDKEIKTFIKKREDFQSKLIDLTLHVTNNKVSECDAHISLLFDSIDQMKPIEVGIFMLSIAYYYYQNNGYVQSAKMVDVLLRRHLNNKKFNLWLDELIFKLSLLTSNVLYVNKKFEKLSLHYQNYGLLDKAYDLREAYHDHMQFIAGSTFYDLGEFDNTIETKKYIFMNRLFKGDAYDVIEPIKMESDTKHYALILALTYDKFGDAEMAKSYLSDIDISSLSPTEAILYDFLKHKHVEEDFGAHLKRALFKDPRIFHNQVLLDFYAYEYVLYHQEAHRYKECVILNTHFTKLYREIAFHFEKIYSE